MGTNQHTKSIIFLLLLSVAFWGQNRVLAQIGLGITTPHPNAYFQINSTNKGVLLPRMTAAQRIAIAPTATANGLLVFDTDSSAYFFWSGTNWQKMGAATASNWTKSGNDIYNNNTGLVGIGTNNPQARLHVADSAVVFTGPTWINEGAYLSQQLQAPGVKMLWYPQRAAFRTGQTSSNQLSRDSVGPFSFATGYDNLSVNYYAFSAGIENRAGGMASAAIGQLNKATGDGAMALGIFNDAQGSATFAAGQANVTFGNNSAAIGNNNHVTGNGAVALGGYNEVSGFMGFAVGSTNTVDGFHATAIGDQNQNMGNRSWVYGTSNENYGMYSLLNGYDNINNANYSIVSGMMSRTETSSAEFSFVMGMGARSEQQYGWAFGNGAIARGTHSIAHGYTVNAQGTGSIAIGNNVATQQHYGVAIGQNTTSTGDYGFAYGYNTISGSRAIAMGYEDSANYSGIAIGQRAVSDWQGVALGFNAFARGNYNIAIGKGQTSTTSVYGTLLGWDNQINGSNSSVIGTGSNVYGFNSGAWGNENIVDGNYSMAAGYHSTVLANNSSSWGNSNSITGENSVTLGNANHHDYCYDCLTVGTHLSVSGNNSIAIGRYNDNSMAFINYPIFQIGNGTLLTPSNALTILSNGNTGIGILDPQEKLHVAGNISSINLAGSGTRVLTADADGTLRTVTAGAEGQVLMTTGGTPQWSSINGWLTNGNWSTNPAINFIGTIDATDLVVRTANVERMRFSSSGNVGIGINTPTQKLDVQGGNARINNSFIGDVGHSSIWAGFAHASQANTTGYALLSSNDGNFTFINKKNTGVGYIGFRVSNTDVAVISNAGKMGIGTNNPTNQLEVIGGPSAQPVFTTVANRGGFGPAGLEFVSDYGIGSQWRPGYIRSNDIGGFTGAVEIYTNGSGAGSLYNSVKGLEVRNGVTYTASGTVSSWSDARLKSNIQPFKDGLAIIQKINPVSFNYTNQAPFPTHQTQIGVVAQALEQVAPYLVEKHTTAELPDLRSVNNQAYVFLLINAVKEQQQQIEQQQTRLTEQQQINKQLQQQIDELKRAIGQR